MNKIIDGPSIFKGQYTSNFNLSERTTKLSKRVDRYRRISSDNIRYLNRFLLEDVYPTELRSSRESIKLNHLIYRTREETRKENPRNPDQEGLPHYINEDLDIFNIILYYFQKPSERINLYFLNSLKIINKKQAKLRLERNLSMEEYQRQLRAIWEETKRNQHNIYHWIHESDNNFDRLERFLASAYVGNLIKKFGIMNVIDLLDFSDMDDKVRIKAILNAHKKQFISEDEYRDIMLNMNAARSSKNSFLVKAVRLRRYELPNYDIPQESS